jgi:hypothetical protein
MYSPYIDYNEYIELGGNTLTAEDADKYLVKTSRQIDILTFNRINQLGGFDKLSKYQQDTIKEVIVNIADFIYSNEDILDNILSSYSINGVSMSFNGNWNLTVRDGVAVRTEDYKLLETTGLTYQGFGFKRWF